MKNKYVIKTKEGSYIGLHSNGKELNFCVTSLDLAPKLSQTDVELIYVRFKIKWQSYDFKVYEIVLSEKPVDKPFI